MRLRGRRSRSTLQQLSIPFLLPYVQEDVPIPPSLPPHPTRPPHFLGPQVFQKLGASSFTEARSRSPPLYTCWGPKTSQCMSPGWWLRVREISRVGARFVETASLPMGSPSSSTSSSLSPVPFPNSTTGFPDFRPLAGCKYLPLSHSAACWVPWREAMLGSFL